VMVANGARMSRTPAARGGPRGNGRSRQLLLGRPTLPLRSGLRVGRSHHAVGQRLEPGPGQPAVGVPRHPRVHVGGLLLGQVPDLARHQPGQVDPHLTGLDPTPQQREPVAQYSVTSGVPDPPGRRDRSRPGLADSSGSKWPSCGDRHAGPRPGGSHLAPPRSSGEPLGMVEQLTARQLLDPTISKWSSKHDQPTPPPPRTPRPQEITPLRRSLGIAAMPGSTSDSAEAQLLRR
jgi:hypothetical protein